VGRPGRHEHRRDGDHLRLRPLQPGRIDSAELGELLRVAVPRIGVVEGHDLPGTLAEVHEICGPDAAGCYSPSREILVFRAMSDSVRFGYRRVRVRPPHCRQPPERLLGCDRLGTQALGERRRRLHPRRRWDRLSGSRGRPLHPQHRRGVRGGLPLPEQPAWPDVGQLSAHRRSELRSHARFASRGPERCATAVVSADVVELGRPAVRG
jgi:hypothetical protein